MPDPWYADGLTFHCTVCGACCTGAPGYVWVAPEEVPPLAKAKGLTPKQFKKRFMRKVGKRLSLRERENGDCTMLDDQGRCTVYQAKPVRCSTFPFWPELLESPEMWDDTAERCEGIGEGDIYTREEIERTADGDTSILLRKQARQPKPAREPAEVTEETWPAALKDLERLYADLEAELPRFQFTCAASGRCCDFDTFGHRLYASTLEAEHFFRCSPEERQNDDERQCPAWGSDKLCHAREGRMLGCRTYFCGPYPVQPPDDIYERYHRRLKAIHDRHGIPFRYQDIIQWRRRGT